MDVMTKKYIGRQVYLYDHSLLGKVFQDTK